MVTTHLDSTQTEDTTQRVVRGTPNYEKDCQHEYEDPWHEHWCMYCGQVRDRRVTVWPRETIRYVSKRRIILGGRTMTSPSTRPLVITFSEALPSGEHYRWPRNAKPPRTWTVELSRAALRRFAKTIDLFIYT